MNTWNRLFRICLPLILVLTLLCACGQAAETTTRQEPHNNQGAGTTWQEQYDLGAQYMEASRFGKAHSAFSAAIELDPSRPEAFIGRGDAGARLNDLTAAQADYQAALDLDETLAEAWLGLADVSIRQGDFDGALELLQEGEEKSGGSRRIDDKIAQLKSSEVTDSSGNLRRKEYYDEQGALAWYHVYTYDGQGFEASATSFDGEGNQTGHVDLEYNEQRDLLVSYDWNWETGVVFPIRYEYIKDGSEVRVEQYDPDETLLCYDVYAYDAAGNKIKDERYDGDGTFLWCKTWEYDEKRNPTLFHSYLPDGTLERSVVYLYDEEGNYLGHEEYDGAGNLLFSTEG